MKTTLAVLATCFLFVACGETSDAPTAPASDKPPASDGVDAAVYGAAVDNPDRSDADRARDAGRQPDVVLEFFGYRCNCLDLPWLIRVKRAAGRPRDLETVAELGALLEERDRQPGSDA